MSAEENKENLEIQKTDAAEAPQGDELQEVMTLVREYAAPVAVGLGIVLAVFLGFTAWRNYKTGLERTASTSLMTARSAQDLENIVSQYPGTPSAPTALLTLAAEYLHSGQYLNAQNAYSRFEMQFPEHPMRPAAKIGAAYCIEGEGRYADADAAFKDFVSSHPDHYLTPVAILGQARCQEQLNNAEGARKIYDDFIAANPESPWLPQARTALLYLEKNMRLAQKK
ncbi:MAG: tetratricopeptide repeat protein [Kiritimatiellia bacterium]